MDFVVVFVVCILIFTLLTVALLFGKAPVYRPSRQEIMLLFNSLEKGELPHERWSLFIGVPIQHDPELEVIRQKCFQLELEAEGPESDICFGVVYRYNSEGMKHIQSIKSMLIKLIAKELLYREF